MKTTYAKKPFKFEFREEQVPAPGAGQVLVEVVYCGICGSDLTFVRKQADDWVPLGHEVSGIVKTIGAGVRNVKPGDRVALDCGNTCGICTECRAGRPGLCTGVQGWYAARSGFADFLLADAQNVHLVGDVDLKAASLLEPFGVAMDMFRNLEIDFLDDVLLVGPGPIGLLALAACKAQGARSITAVGRSAGARIDYAKDELGAETIVAEDVADLLSTKLLNSFDKIILTAPPDLLPAAVEAARPSGIIAYCGLGAAGSSVVPINWDTIHGKNIQIRPMGALPRHQAQAIELLRRGTINSDKFISHVFSLDQIEEAFQLIETNRDEVIKVVIQLKQEI